MKSMWNWCFGWFIGFGFIVDRYGGDTVGKYIEGKQTTILLPFIRITHFRGVLHYIKTPTILTKTSRAKGGHARAAKLSPERRKEIAVNAANKRWSKNGTNND